MTIWEDEVDVEYNVIELVFVSLIIIEENKRFGFMRTFTMHEYLDQHYSNGIINFHHQT